MLKKDLLEALKTLDDNDPVMITYTERDGSNDPPWYDLFIDAVEVLANEIAYICVSRDVTSKATQQ